LKSGYIKVKKRFLSHEFQNHLWIFIATAISAPFSAIMVLITARLISLESAGMMQYANAVAAIFSVLVIFSISYIQSVDVREEYSFKTYLETRTITAALTTIILFVFIVVVGLDVFQSAVLLLYYFIFLTDSYANVFTTDFHQKGKIRITGRMRASGFSIILVSYIIIAYLTHDVIISLLVAGVLFLINNVAWIWFYRSHFGAIRTKVNLSAVKRLILAALPIVVLIFIMTFLAGAPNIYIGQFDSMGMVAIFAMILTPGAFFQMLLHALFFGAPLPVTSEAYASGDLKRFSFRIHALLILTVIVAVPFLIVVYFIGIPVLSWLYNIDLTSYQIQLLFVSTGAIFLTLGPIIGMALIIMKRQKIYMYSYIAVGAVAGPAVAVLVWLYGINGAMLSNLIVFAPLTFLLYVIFRRALKSDATKV